MFTWGTKKEDEKSATGAEGNCWFMIRGATEMENKTKKVSGICKDLLHD